MGGLIEARCMDALSTCSFCACGCGLPLIPFDAKGRPRRFLNGHNRRRPIEERFWEKVDKSGDCWVWTASVDLKGYGNFKHPLGSDAHTFSWTLHYGPITGGLCVLHRCDNPPCIRPNHLFLGTRADNNLDMIDKGRAWYQQDPPPAQCKHGHEYTAETLYINPTGARCCRVCARERSVKWQQTHKDKVFGRVLDV